ncbi:MAG TPA: sigma-70 family RNA polymerase sigma factor [Solirubrobacterales bacterium]|nr:sigma-70 family RNA polymerase sigma factor [Solirubrobacterales bacterium]
MGLVRDGHDRAFEEIVRRYRSSLVTFAGGIVPGDHAEDVVQEALTKAHTALGRGDAEINLRPWLYTIVRNGALNALRDEPAHAHLDENLDGVPQPPEVAARREQLAALTAQVRSLPGPQREAIVKRELEGLSHEEIASLLGVTAGAVRGLIYRARAALRDGAGMLIPMPALRALLSSGSASPEATGAAAAAVAAGGGGGIAVKAGATLGVAVIAVGSGFAVQHRSSESSEGPAAARGKSIHASRAHDGRLSAADVTRAGVGREDESGHEGPGSGSGDSGGRDGHERSSGSSSGPGSGSDSGSESSGEGSGTGDGDDGGGSGSSGPDGGELDDGGSSGSGDGGGSETSGSSDDGGSSGSDSSGSDSSGSGSSGSGSSGDGSETTTTTTTTTTDDSGGTSGGSG